MSAREDELVARSRRGGRVREVREALGLTQDDFAARVVATSAAFGERVQLDKHQLSRIEGGTRLLTVEEAAAIVFIDPEERSIHWLVYGRSEPERASKPIEPGIVRPSPRKQGRAEGTR